MKNSRTFEIGANDMPISLESFWISELWTIQPTVLEILVGKANGKELFVRKFICSVPHKVALFSRTARECYFILY